MLKSDFQISMLVGLLAFGLSSCGPKAPNQMLSGANDSRIIGGDKVEASDSLSKSIVAIVNVKEGYLCTGSILDDSTILTAAHCAEGEATNNVILFGLAVDKNAVQRKVTNAAQHPNYKNGEVVAKNMSDIAVMHFDGGLPPGYVPAKLLVDYDKLSQANKVVVAGYGMSVPIAARLIPSGAGKLRRTDLLVENFNYSDTEVQLDQKITRGVCEGDSGGPSYLQSGRDYLLWGVTSRGAGLPKIPCMFSSVFTRIDQFLPWIQETANSLK